MIRNLKALGLVLATVFVTSAVAAQAAFGVDTFTASSSSVGVTGTGGGSGNGKFKITSNEGGEIASFHCQTNTFTGTMVNGSSLLQVTPLYKGKESEPGSEECDASLGSTKIHMNGCTYVLAGNTTGNDGGTDATFWINCPGTNQMEFTAPLGCKIKIPAQTPTSGGVTYANEPGSPNDFKVKATITGITFTSMGNGCRFLGIPASANTADYNESVTFKGNGAVPIQVSES